MKSFLSKLTLGLTGGLAIAFQSGLLANPKVATYTAIGLAILQAFTPRVQQSASDVAVADSAVAATKATV